MKRKTMVEIFFYSGRIEDHDRINDYLKKAENNGWEMVSVSTCPSGINGGMWVTVIMQK